MAALQADQLQLTPSFLTDRLAFDNQAHGFASDQVIAAGDNSDASSTVRS